MHNNFMKMLNNMLSKTGFLPQLLSSLSAFKKHVAFFIIIFRFIVSMFPLDYITQYLLPNQVKWAIN